MSIYTNVRIENLDSVGYLVSAGEERGRHTEAELLRGFEIDDEFELFVRLGIATRSISSRLVSNVATGLR